ncbi:two-component system response regulator NarL [Vibrio sp. J1-1]|uniref:two-component system response regulator NarL n=1 Tax=Vibrio sp. J1-1 TaxID=2912251 RepID=UPI001F0050D1|nr:two-component system response regulator NarL [Vibrio sp. J1-1]MCF7480977.1 two-component system response regulator NarL [Vibrio sp. J1-1]
MLSTQDATIMLVDDHPLFRSGLRQLIALEEGLQVICEYNNGTDAIEGAVKHDPDLIILDLNMQGIDGLETVRQMRERGVTSRVVMLTVSDNEDDVLNAISSGADGYLLKDMEPEDIVTNIKQAVLGQLALSDRLTKVLLQSCNKPKKIAQESPLKSLTNRELEILSLISKGMSNKLIAHELKITDSTVKVHVKNLMKKLNVSSRLEAAVWMIDNQ